MTAAASGPVFTVGHSNRTLEEFLPLLKAHGVDLLADVRTVPRSLSNPQFNSDSLPAALREAGIGYEHIPALGGFRRKSPDSRNAGWRNASFRNYADYMGTPEFEHGLRALARAAEGKTPALMCAEAVPWRCHRSLIADALVARGVPVSNIVGATGAKPHALKPFARVADGKVTYPAEEGGPDAGRVAKEAATIADLRSAKAFSDRRDYKGKHRVMRKLLDERPHEFHIDSEKGPFVGVTHGPSGFRMHLPRKVVSGYNLQAAAKAAEHTHTRAGRTYDVEKLLALLAGRPAESIPLDQIPINRSSNTGFSKKRYAEADASYPGIVGPDGSLVDGRHRTAKLLDQGATRGLYRRAAPEDMEAVELNKAAAPLPRAVMATLPRARRARPAARRVVRPVAPEPEPEPVSPEAVLGSVAQSLRARRRRARLRKAQAFAAVPEAVVAKVAGALPSRWPQGDPLADPDALVSRISLASQALPEAAAFSADSLLRKSALASRLFSKEALDPDTTGLFTPSIPVDAFNNAVWTDAWRNPFGSRSSFGDDSQTMSTPPEVAAAVSGLVAGAGAERDSSHVSPWDVAMAAGAAAGKGWLGGLVLGKTVGALAGMPPSAQKKLQDVGLWGGLLTGAVRSVFGGSR